MSSSINQILFFLNSNLEYSRTAIVPKVSSKLSWFFKIIVNQTSPFWDSESVRNSYKCLSLITLFWGTLRFTRSSPKEYSLAFNFWAYHLNFIIHAHLSSFISYIIYSFFFNVNSSTCIMCHGKKMLYREIYLKNIWNKRKDTIVTQIHNLPLIFSPPFFLGSLTPLACFFSFPLGLLF